MENQHVPLLQDSASPHLSSYDDQIAQQQIAASAWFAQLRDSICTSMETLEQELNSEAEIANPASFIRTSWQRPGGGGGEMALLRGGQVFEKVGVNISTVHGNFSPTFAKEIPGTDSENTAFWASGISLVAHPLNPHVPAVHMNTRFIVTQKSWFGGGADITPCLPNPEISALFHQGLKEACDRYDPTYYSKFRDECARYFFLPHRQEERGDGGIFYDYLNTGSWQSDFGFTQAVGHAFHTTYTDIVRKTMRHPWTASDREAQLRKRGRYVEFNLLYDRGTKFGLMTDGNTEAILMSLPPLASW